MEKSFEILNPGSFNDYVQEAGHLPLDHALIVGFYNDALRAYNNARTMQGLNVRIFNSEDFAASEEATAVHPGQGTLFTFPEDASN